MELRPARPEPRPGCNPVPFKIISVLGTVAVPPQRPSGTNALLQSYKYTLMKDAKALLVTVN